MTRTRVNLVSAALVTLVAGCGRGALSGPPEIRLGRDECDECNMLIAEDRCSCALLIERAGRRDHARFDDVGCLLDYEHQTPPDVRIVEGFVRDHGSRAWVPIAQAWFLLSESSELATPMGSGIVAFADRTGVEAARGQWGGTILDHAAVRAARQSWMETRYGKPEPVPESRR